MCEQVANAVQCIFDPNSEPTIRRQAHQLLEEIKESDSCLDVGFSLLQTDGPVTVQHCGLQFIEHVIRYKWSKLSPDKRLEIKNRCASCISNLSELQNPHLLIREGLARCMVEMVKREWPQAWPDFLEECEKFCSLGMYQAETVLLLYARLVQDIILFNSVDHQTQSKNLHNALVQFSGNLMDLPLNILKMTTDASLNNDLIQEKRIKLCSAALLLLNNLVHWTPSAVLTPRVPQLLNAIEVFLVSGPHCLAADAISCLYELATRKGSKKDVECLVPLLTVKAIQPICTFIKELSSREYEEQLYVLLRPAAQLLIPLCTDMVVLWDSVEVRDQRLPTLNLLLSVILLLISHPSMRIRCLTSQSIVAMVKCVDIISSDVYRAFYEQFIQKIPSAMFKRTVSSGAEEPTCSFDRAEYDNVSAYIVDMTRVRECCCVTIREDVQHDYKPSCQFIFTWCKSVLDSPKQMTEDPLFDCFLLIYSTVCEAMQKNEQTITAFRKEAADYLDRIFTVLESTADVQVISKVLSLFTALIPFIDETYGRLSTFMSRLVWWMMCDDKEHDFMISNHIAHLLVKLASTCPKLLMPHFDVISDGLKTATPLIRDRVKCHMVDVLFAISNELNSYEFQRAQCSSYLADTVHFWTNTVQWCLSSPEQFLCYICSMQTVAKEPPVFITRRKEFIFHTTIVSSIVNRIVLPEDAKVAADGGYSIVDETGVARIRHPAFDTCLPLIPAIFRLARCVNGIYEESCIKKMPAEFSSSILDLMTVEKLSVIGNYNQLKNDCGEEKLFSRTTTEDHIRGFLADISEMVQTLVARMVGRFGWQFYKLPESERMLELGLLGYIECCLDFRLHILIRKAMVPIVAGTDDGAVPILLKPLAKLIEHCYHRLTIRWTAVFKSLEQTDFLHRDLSDQEVYLEHMTCILTRDVAALLRQMCEVRSNKMTKVDSQNNVMGERENDNENEMTVDIGCSGNLTTLATELLSEKVDSYAWLVLLMFHMLGWHDSQSVINISGLCYPVASECLRKRLLDAASAKHLFSCVLQGVQQHCMVDDTLGKLFDLACKLYELFFVPFPNACKEVLLTLPDTAEDVVSAFDQKMQNCVTGSVKTTDRVKRTMFKKVVKAIINPQEYVKRKQDFRELPIMLRPKRQPSAFELKSENELQLLFSSR